jgi:hypothetical protein
MFCCLVLITLIYTVYRWQVTPNNLTDNNYHNKVFFWKGIICLRIHIRIYDNSYYENICTNHWCTNVSFRVSNNIKSILHFLIRKWTYCVWAVDVDLFYYYRKLILKKKLRQRLKVFSWEEWFVNRLQL